MPVVREGGLQFLDDGMRGALLAEKLAAHVVIDADNLPAFSGKLADAFRADEPAGQYRVIQSSSIVRNVYVYYPILAPGAYRAVRTKTNSLHPRDPPQVINLTSGNRAGCKSRE